MKIILFVLLQLLLLGSLGAQTTAVAYCGLDDASTLNAFESQYFNEVFAQRRGDFDFTDKQVAYFTGSAGKTRSTKSRYFQGLKNGNTGERDIHQWQAGGTQLLILTKAEKDQSGGYDVILVSWSKLAVPKEKLVKKLGQPQKGKNETCTKIVRRL